MTLRLTVPLPATWLTVMVEVAEAACPKVREEGLALRAKLNAGAPIVTEKLVRRVREPLVPVMVIWYVPRGTDDVVLIEYVAVFVGYNVGGIRLTLAPLEGSPLWLRVTD
jgi:hypothetical protein